MTLFDDDRNILKNVCHHTQQKNKEKGNEILNWIVCQNGFWFILFYFFYWIRLRFMIEHIIIRTDANAYFQ